MKAILVLLLSGTALLLAGCASAVEMRTFHIAGGEEIQLPIERGGAKATENSDIKIEVTGFMLNTERKEIIYSFGFTEKNREVPRSVKVEDVSGTQAQVLIVDATPHLSSRGFWKGTATPKTKGDPDLSWLYEDGDTIKVFRFTITTADGRVLVMHQASVWPGNAKPILRRMLERND